MTLVWNNVDTAEHSKNDRKTHPQSITSLFSLALQVLMSQRLQTFCRNCCSCKMQNHRFADSDLENLHCKMQDCRFQKSAAAINTDFRNPANAPTDNCSFFCIHNLLSVTASACGSTRYQCATNNVVLDGLPFQSYDPCQCNLISSIVK